MVVTIGPLQSLEQTLDFSERRSLLSYNIKNCTEPHWVRTSDPRLKRAICPMCTSVRLCAVMFFNVYIAYNYVNRIVLARSPICRNREKIWLQFGYTYAGY